MKLEASKIACSVVTPSYNCEQYVGGTISSVQKQAFDAWELLVSDDGSTDGTLEVVRDYTQRDDRIRLLTSATNQGPARARNAAIEAAQGRYIAFLDSDDLWKPQKLERQIAFMQEHDIAFSFSSYDCIDGEGNYLGTRQMDKPVTYHDLLKTNVIGCLTAIYDTQKLGKVYMPDIRKRQDFGLWLKLLKLTEAAYPLRESLAQYRIHENTVSSNKLNAAKYTWAIYRDVEKLGFIRSAYYFMHYATRGVTGTYLSPAARRSLLLRR